MGHEKSHLGSKKEEWLASPWGLVTLLPAKPKFGGYSRQRSSSREETEKRRSPEKGETKATKTGKRGGRKAKNTQQIAVSLCTGTRTRGRERGTEARGRVGGGTSATGMFLA